MVGAAPVRPLNTLLREVDPDRDWQVEGNARTLIADVYDLDDPRPGGLRWYRGDEAISTTATVLVCQPDVTVDGAAATVRTGTPRRDFTTLAKALTFDPDPVGSIHPTATLVRDVSLGHPVTIGAGTVIGGPGFGFDQHPDRTWHRTPHYAGVRIGARTTIGANTCIDRGVLTDTIIGEDCHIDNLVHIAHGAVLGRGTMVVAGTVIGGSAVIGAETWVGMNASIGEGVNIGPAAIIGAGTVVTRDVPAGATIVGVNREITGDRAQRAARYGYVE